MENEINIIKMAQKGNSNAVNELLIDHKRWIRSLTIKFHSRFPKIDNDSIESILYESLWKSIMKFNPEESNKAITIRTFGMIIAKREFFKELRSQKTMKRFHQQQEINFNNIASNEIRFLTRDIEQTNTPCIDCGTTRGFISKRQLKPTRIKGRCSVCRNVFDRKRKN